MERNSKFDAFIKYCNANLKEKKLREFIFSSEKDAVNGFYNYRPIFQTHGHWILQVDFYYFKYKEKYFSLGFQYQNETYKINCMQAGAEYWSSHTEHIEEFFSIFREFSSSCNYRINYPKTREYISMSKKYKGISLLSDNEFVKTLFPKMLDAKTIVEKLVDEFKQKGCRFVGK